MKLFADSGSTKTEWILLKNNNIQERYSTKGMNPFFIEKKTIISEINDNLKKIELDQISEVYFYGAGCSTPDKSEWLKNIFQGLFRNAKIFINTDIEGAVLSVSKFGEKCVVSILGTGSSFRIFDGKNIQKKYSSLGYIIGDEGSGTHISKALLRKVFYKHLPNKLEEAFFEFFKFSREEIIENVYSKPLPNRYLAQFTVFCKKYIQEEEIEKIILKSFDEYLVNHILPIENIENYSLYFIGSIAYYFQDQLFMIAKKYNLNIRGIVQKPISKIVENSN